MVVRFLLRVTPCDSKYPNLLILCGSGVPHFRWRTKEAHPIAPNQVHGTTFGGLVYARPKTTLAFLPDRQIRVYPAAGYSLS